MAEQDDNPRLSRRDLIDAAKEGVKELIDERVKAFGWWSLRTVTVIIAGAIVVFVLWANGYQKGVG